MGRQKVDKKSQEVERRVGTIKHSSTNRILGGSSAMLGVGLLCVLLVPTAVQAASAETSPSAATAVQSEIPASFTAADLAARSDVELTALTARWAELDPGQRRVLLAEVRSRMARNEQTRQPRVSIRVQRKYGRVVRKPDGSVVLETRVVEMRPRENPDAARGTFGVGFEQRSKRSGEAQAQQAEDNKPAVTVSQQPTEP